MFFYLISVILTLSSFPASGKGDGDPRRNITCLGSSYEFRIPIRPDGVDLNRLTMQQLCAQPVYDGADIPRVLGGWCSAGLEIDYQYEIPPGDPPWGPWGPSDTSRPRTGVSFDHTVSRSVQPGELQPDGFNDERLYAGCLNRCFCNWGVEDLSIQPKREVPSNADVMVLPTPTDGL